MPPSPYTFDRPDADVILRAPLQPGSDGFKDFRVHKLILSLASAVFQDMFSIPQPHHNPLKEANLDVVLVTDSAEVVETFLQIVYPAVGPPVLEDLRLLNDLFQLADKYLAEGITGKLRELLVSPSFLKNDPIGVFAVAHRNNLEKELEISIPYTFPVDIAGRISETALHLLTSKAYHRLLVEHADRRNRLVNATNRAQHSRDQMFDCQCGDRLTKEICLQLARRPFFDTKVFEECLSSAHNPGRTCKANGCVLKPGVGYALLSEIFTRMEKKQNVA